MLGNIKVVVIILHAYGGKINFTLFFFANVAEFSSESHYNNWIYLFNSH